MLSGCHSSVVEHWVQFLVTSGFSLSSVFMIYGTGNDTGNPVHLPSPTCALTNPNFRCHVFQVIQNSFVCLAGEWKKKKDVYYTANQELLEDQRVKIRQSTGHV